MKDYRKMRYDDYEKLLKFGGAFYYVGKMSYTSYLLTAYTGNCSGLDKINLNILFEDANDFSKWKYFNRNQAFTEILEEKFIW